MFARGEELRKPGQSCLIDARVDDFDLLEAVLGEAMKLEPPLAAMIRYCETGCVAGCCGLNAFEFSEENVVTYLNSVAGAKSAESLELLRAQIAVLRTLNAPGRPALRIDDFEDTVSSENLDAAATEMEEGLKAALSSWLLDVIKPQGPT